MVGVGMTALVPLTVYDIPASLTVLLLGFEVTLFVGDVDIAGGTTTLPLEDGMSLGLVPVGDIGDIGSDGSGGPELPEVVRGDAIVVIG